MTRAELFALPPATDIPTAGRALGIGRTKAYELAKVGAFPLRVERVGDQYRVLTADLLRYLGLDLADWHGGAAAMTREQAFTEAAQLLTDACAEADALPAEQAARAAHTPGGHTIAELVDMVRAQRAEARSAKNGDAA